MATRALIAVGGPLHGEMVEIDEGRLSHHDIESASAYFAKDVLSQNHETGEGIVKEVLMHETVLQNDVAGTQALVAAVMSRWFADGGRKLDAPVPVVTTAAPTAPGQPPTRTTRSGLVLPG